MQKGAEQCRFGAHLPGMDQRGLGGGGTEQEADNQGLQQKLF